MRLPESTGRPLSGAPRNESARESKADLQSLVEACDKLQPIVVRAPGAALLLDVSLRTVQKMHSTGAMPRALRLGRCCVWSVEELRAWIRAGCPSRDRWEATRGRAT
jgi:predicted DNA-binding transcriptional regulator AlpA